MHIFTETTASDESWAVSWERPSQYVQQFPNILLDGWKDLKVIPLKKGSLKVHTLKKFSAALHAAKLLPIFSLRCSMASTLQNLLPTPMALPSPSRLSCSTRSHLYNV